MESFALRVSDLILARYMYAEEGWYEPKYD